MPEKPVDIPLKGDGTNDKDKPDSVPDEIIVDVNLVFASDCDIKASYK